MFNVVSPLICRRIRSKLNREAETSSVEVFAKNLRNMLLTKPVREKVILGMDPGKVILASNRIELFYFLVGKVAKSMISQVIHRTLNLFKNIIVFKIGLVLSGTRGEAFLVRIELFQGTFFKNL